MTPDLYADPQHPALPKADIQLNAAADHDDAVAMDPSTKLRVRTPSAACAPRKRRAKALTSAPGSSYETPMK